MTDDLRREMQERNQKMLDSCDSAFRPAPPPEFVPTPPALAAETVRQIRDAQDARRYGFVAEPEADQFYPNHPYVPSENQCSIDPVNFTDPDRVLDTLADVLDVFVGSEPITPTPQEPLHGIFDSLVGSGEATAFDSLKLAESLRARLHEITFEPISAQAVENRNCTFPEESIPLVRDPIYGIFNDIIDKNNTETYQLIESQINKIRNNAKPNCHFELIGSPNCNNIFTANVISKSLEFPFVLINSRKINANNSMEVCFNALFKTHSTNNSINIISGQKTINKKFLIEYNYLKSTVICISDANLLSQISQTSIAKMMQNKFYPIFDSRIHYNWNNIIFIFISNESSKFIGQLNKMIIKYYFQQYSIDSLKLIINKKFNFNEKLLNQIINKSKKNPYLALEISNKINSKNPNKSFSKLYPSKNKNQNISTNKNYLKKSKTIINKKISGIFDHLVTGENSSAFKLIEALVNAMQREPEDAHHFGLFGPASCGKTTTAELIAKALDRPYFGADAGYFNATPGGQGFIKALFKAFEASHLSEVSINDSVNDLKSGWLLKSAIIFIDEAHELNAANQNILLSMMEKPYRTHWKSDVYDWKNITIILATTDSSRLVKPLRTRTHEVSFEAYSAETVAAIVEKTSDFKGELARRIALAAKLIPRRALQIARVLDPSNPEETLEQLYAIDEQGLDARDRRILEVLRSNITPVDQVKLREAQRIVEMSARGKQITAARLAKAEATLEFLEPEGKPIGLSNLADRLGLSDQRDLQDRINALVNRGFVERTSKGIIAKQNVR